MIGGVVPATGSNTISRSIASTARAGRDHEYPYAHMFGDLQCPAERIDDQCTRDAPALAAHRHPEPTDQRGENRVRRVPVPSMWRG
jgi:hypothetical protein